MPQASTSPRCTAVLRAICVLTLLAVCSSPSEGQVDSYWINPAGGNWIEPNSWSTPDYPHNNGQTYNATIDLETDPYTVTLNNIIHIDHFTLNSDSATLDHTGSGFFVDSANLLAGRYRLNGGWIVGGTWNVAPGTFEVTDDDNNAFRDVTFNGDLQLSATNAYLELHDSFTIDGSIRLSGSGATLTLWGGPTLDNTTVTFDATTSGTKRIDSYFGGALVLGPNLTVHGGRGRFEGGEPVLNRGLISANASGEKIEIVPNSFTNEGIAQAVNNGTLVIGTTGKTWSNAPAGLIRANGGTLDLGGNWSNQGTLEIASGTVNLRGSFSTAGLGTWNRTGGSVNLYGQLDNRGAVFTLDDTIGPWEMRNGEILGGVVNLADPELLQFGWYTTNYVNGVTINGDVELSRSSAILRIRNGFTINGTLTTASSVTVQFEGDQTLHAGTLSLAPTNWTFYVIDGSTLTLGPDVAMRGGGGLIYAPQANVINEGLISAEVPGKALKTAILSFENRGTIEAVNGGIMQIGDSLSTSPWVNAAGATIRAVDSTLLLYGRWSNAGTITATDSDVTLGGSFAVEDLDTFARSGGTVRLSGVLDNTGNDLLLDAATGSWRLEGGTIQGGSVNFADDQQLLFTNQGGILAGVAFNGDVVLDDFPRTASVLIGLGTTINGNVWVRGNSSLRVRTGQAFDNTTVTFQSPFGGGVTAWGEGTLILGSNLTIQTGSSYGAIGGGLGTRVVNRGRIAANTATDLIVGGYEFLNEGLIEASNGGILDIQAGGMDRPWQNGPTGQISAVDATLILGSCWENRGTISAVNSEVILDGTFATADIGDFNRLGGTVYVRGELDNLDDTLVFDSESGSWWLQGGTIQGGTLMFSEGERLRISSWSDNTLDGVTISGDLELEASVGSYLNVRSGLTVDGMVTIAGGTLKFRGTQTFDDTTVCFPPDATRVLRNDEGTLTLGPNLTIRGGSADVGYYSPLINQGRIVADVGGRTVQIWGEPVTNDGMVEARNGGRLRFMRPDQLTNLTPGTLTGGRWAVYAGSTIDLGSSTITTNAADVVLSGVGSRFDALSSLQHNAGDLAIVDGRDFQTVGDFLNDGTLAIGAGSAVTVDGGFEQASTGTLAFEIAGLLPGQDFGFLEVVGEAGLAGRLRAILADDFEPRLGDSFAVLTAHRIAGTFSSSDLPDLPGMLSFSIAYSLTAVRLIVIPEPTSAFLLVAGTAALIVARGVARRRAVGTADGQVGTP